MTAVWIALIVACVGSYLLKLGGLSLPEAVLNHPLVQRVASFLPVAMLAALVALELFDGGGGKYAFDWRTLAGVAAAVVALLLRAGVLVVFVLAITVTALLRLLT